jgi:hypothetical protein
MKFLSGLFLTSIFITTLFGTPSVPLINLTPTPVISLSSPRTYTLMWTDTLAKQEHINGYKIYQSHISNFSSNNLTAVYFSSTNYINILVTNNSSLWNGNIYYFQVTAINTNNHTESKPSNTICITNAYQSNKTLQ